MSYLGCFKKVVDKMKTKEKLGLLPARKILIVIFINYGEVSQESARNHQYWNEAISYK